MGFVTSIMTEQQISIAFYSQDQSVVNGVIQPQEWTLVDTVPGLLWTGASGLGIVSDKLKTQVEGAVAIDYNVSILAMKDDSRFVVGGENYRIIHIEDVGHQNEMLQIYYKREAGN